MENNGALATRPRTRAWIAAGAMLAAGLGLSLGTMAHAGEEDPCTATSFSIAKVEQACKSGGRKAAKTVMKQAVKKAKDAGESMTCKTCHGDLEKFTLTDNAVADLKKWL